MKNDFLELLQEGDKMEASFAARATKVENFEEKLAGFIGLLTNERGYRTSIHRAYLQEAETTSDFPLLFGTVLERTLLGKYQIAKPDWRGYVATGTQADFRIANAFQMFGLQGSLNSVKERGEYKADKLGEGKFAIQLKKYGKKFPLSWEALINDDLGAFSDAAGRLADSALRTEFTQATSLFSTVGGPNSTLFGTAFPHPIDGVSVTNLGALPLTGPNLASTITAMKSQVDADGEPIIITRFHVVVPVALEFQLMTILSNALLIGQGANAGVTTSENVIASYPITKHTNPYLDIIDKSGKATTTWYVFADLAEGAAVKMNFLRGRENPEIVQKISDKLSLGGGAVSPLEGDFDADTLVWRVRHIMGGTQMDPRFAYAQTGS